MLSSPGLFLSVDTQGEKYIKSILIFTHEVLLIGRTCRAGTDSNNKKNTWHVFMPQLL